MINIFSRFLSAFLFAVCSFITVSVNAVLPQELDGNELPSLAPMLENVTPAVVNIATEGRVKQRQSPLFSDPFFRHFFKIPDQPVERKTSSLGSGVIVDSERGLVLTNHHVIANAIQITITMRDGRQVEAEIVGADPKTDIALLKVNSKSSLPFVEFGNSDNARVGDWVLAIGNPFGFGGTVTSGIISSKNRDIGGRYDDFIQTDASINPGNSGGPLINLDGNIIGVNTGVAAIGSGVGFAIPIETAIKIANQLVESGSVARGWLGIGIQELTPELANTLEFKNTNGVLVNSVALKTPAREGGIEQGDIILQYDGKSVLDLKNLQKMDHFQVILLLTQNTHNFVQQYF